MYLQVIIFLVLIVELITCSVIASTIIRTPSLDSSIVNYNRVGDSFAYSTIEGHAYAALSPIWQNLIVSPITHPQISLIHPYPGISYPNIISQNPVSIPSPSSGTEDADTITVESV